MRRRSQASREEGRVRVERDGKSFRNFWVYAILEEVLQKELIGRTYG